MENPEADAPRQWVRLSNQTPQSRTTIHGWPAFLFGLPFVAAGIYPLLIAFDLVEYDPSKVHAPLWVIGVFGAMFSLAGLFMIVHGILGIGRKRRLKRGLQTSPEQPWLWDFVWDPKGFKDRKLKELVNYFLGLIVFAAFMAPFNWWAFVSEDGSLLVILVTLLFDLIVLVIAGSLVYKLGQFLKYGSPFLRYQSFPFFLGEPAGMTLEAVPANLDTLKAQLRYIEERYEMQGSGNNRSQKVVCYQVYEQSQQLQKFARNPGGDLHLEWQLPDNPGLASELSKRPANYWALEITGDTPGIDYYAYFLVPVYNKTPVAAG